MEIRMHHGDREPLRALFEQADAPGALATYFDDGQVFVAVDEDGTVVGHLQLVPHSERVIEVTNTAVSPTRQGQGIGRQLMEFALAHAKAEGYTTVEVATASCDVGNLRFYQRLGFRMTHIVRDVFTPENGYPEEMVDGIALRDQVCFDLTL